MDKKLDNEIDQNEGKSLELLQKLADTARPEAVFSKPVKIGDTQIITASEIQVGMGFGFGSASGPFFMSNLEDGEEQLEVEDNQAAGRGAGGGGGASGRPVAVISISDDGVEIDPVFDVTKIALAFITMLVSMFFMGARMNKRLK